MFLKLGRYASNSQGNSILTSMQYSRTYERGRPYWDPDWFEGRKGPKPNKVVHPPMILLRSILAGETGVVQIGVLIKVYKDRIDDAAAPSPRKDKEQQEKEVGNGRQRPEE